MDWQIYNVVFLLLLLFFLIAPCIILIRSSNQEKFKLFTILLPAFVGVIAALIGYQATNRATELQERVFEKESGTEVRETAETAIGLYAKLLISIELAYAEATLLEGRFLKVIKQKTGQEKLAELKILQETLAGEMMGIDTALRNIAVNSFANSCYQKQWEDKEDELWSLKIEEKFDFHPSKTIDFIRLGRFLRVGAESLQSEKEILEHLKLAEVLAKEVQNNLQNSNQKPQDKSYRPFLFLGNLISFFTNSKECPTYVGLHGSALLADFITTVPDQDKVKECLKTYYGNNESLLKASEQYKPISDPHKTTPTLRRSLEEMKKSERFSYHYCSKVIEMKL